MADSIHDFTVVDPCQKNPSEELIISWVAGASSDISVVSYSSPHDHVACLFLIFCIHFIALSIIFQLYFYENSMVDNKRQDLKWLSAYSRVLCIFSSCQSS